MLYYLTINSILVPVSAVNIQLEPLDRTLHTAGQWVSVSEDLVMERKQMKRER